MTKDFIEKPIPNLDQERAGKGYRDYPVVPKDEEIVDLLRIGIAGENYYYHFKLDDGGKVAGAIPNLFARKSVSDKLVEINNELFGLGLELFVRDTYRPPEVQKFMHDVWAPNHLQEQHPDWSDEKVKNEVSKYWAYVNNNGTWDVDPQSPPPHTTGGAIDLTLRNRKTEEILDMGAKFDELGESVYPDFLEKLEDITVDQEKARNGRRLLYWTMLSHGFVNNPTEWWHFSFGDQMWAQMTGASNAVYSNILLDVR